jgi:hypothetical protein
MAVSHFVKSPERLGLQLLQLKQDTRLVNVGFIKSVSPIFDLSIVEENRNILKPDPDNKRSSSNRMKTLGILQL